MARAGTPIRLIREDGGLIELLAFNIVMSTERKFGPKAFPFSGSNRASLDLNVNRAAIIMQGIFIDDETEVAAVGASALINFAKTSAATTHFLNSTNLNRILSTTSGDANLKLVDSNGDTRLIKLQVAASTTGASYNTSTDTVIIGENTTSASSVASAVKTAIDTDLSTFFTATLKDTENGSGEIVTNGGLLIQQKVIGSFATTGNNDDLPKIKPATDRVGNLFPSVETFSGGQNKKQLSAGDKAQELYSIANNSSRKTLRQVANSFGNVFRRGQPYSEVGTDTFIFGKGSDYIVGIQIPFNSMANAGTGDKYTPVNFFMPTGLFFDKSEKTAENALAAGTVFNERDNFTGISGGLKQLEIAYDAGEAIYNFDLTFLPSDAMW
tara:strand:- start:3625 stop:4773 length:1149 start_codon:yes stop_codon:yes gene_type:complete